MNSTPDYYVYQYVREDGTPYYIGKGTRSRAWNPHPRFNGSDLRPKDKNRIQIVKGNITDAAAKKLERELIALHGRKDRGGILLNLTDGGDGKSGQVHSAETRKKMSESHKGKTLTEEHRKKMSESHKKRFVENPELKERLRELALIKIPRPPVSCRGCRKEGKMPTMTRHFTICNERITL